MPSFTLLVTGQKHFETSGNILTDIQTLKDHFPRRPSLFRRAISEDLDIVIQKGLHPDRNERYQDAESLAADIKAVIEDMPIMARRENTMQKAVRWAKRHKSLHGDFDRIFCSFDSSFHHLCHTNVEHLEAYREAEAS